MSRDSEQVVRAAGGIVRSPRPNGTGDTSKKRATEELRILLVHRPRYDDWSLPKGKADAGERSEDTALREVREETGLRCRLGPEVGRTRYRDSRGRRKEVRYWLMDPEDDDVAFVPNAEVDEIRWCSPREAGKLLSYEHDRQLVDSVAGELG